MKYLLCSGIVTLSMALLSSAAIPFWGDKANAAQFGQKEVDQSKYIAVAMPLTSGHYKLLILEQISPKRPCWKENGSAPTIVDPLLVSFNFTGICGRNIDSNGYSIRVANQDLVMQYNLGLEQLNGEIVLVGRSGAGSMMLIGRTRGMADGFLKILLEPGWQFSRRVFKSKTLGHVYFSNDSPAMAMAVGASPTNTPVPQLVFDPATVTPMPSTLTSGVIMIPSQSSTAPLKLNPFSPNTSVGQKRGQPAGDRPPHPGDAGETGDDGV